MLAFFGLGELKVGGGGVENDRNGRRYRALVAGFVGGFDGKDIVALVKIDGGKFECPIGSGYTLVGLAILMEKEDGSTGLSVAGKLDLGGSSSNRRDRQLRNSRRDGVLGADGKVVAADIG